MKLGYLRSVIREILAEEALGLHGAGMGEKELKGSLGYGGIELNRDGSITDEEADSIAKKVSKDKPERIFAYSRGAAALSKAAQDDDMPGLPPVTYVAPAALRKWTDAPVPSVPGGSVTIIGDKDAAVPVKQACKIAKQAGTPLYVFPGKSHKSILYTHGEVGSGAFEVDVDGCVADDELPDWGPSAQGSAEDVAKQQQAIAKYRKDGKKANEALLRTFIRECYGWPVADEKHMYGVKVKRKTPPHDPKNPSLKLPKGFNTRSKMVNEMLTVRTMVAPSQVKGEGLYAAEFIPKGTIVSRWVEGSDRTFPNEHVEGLDPEAQTRFKELASWDGDSWFLSGDDAIYFNHSKSPNIRVIMGRGSPATWDRVAIKDIDPGEELTMDYCEIGIDPL